MPAEQARGLNQSALVADLHRQFHQRQADGTDSAPEKPRIDLERTAKRNLRQRIIALPVNARRPRWTGVAGEIRRGGHQNLGRNPGGKKALSGGDIRGIDRTPEAEVIAAARTGNMLGIPSAWTIVRSRPETSRRCGQLVLCMVQR